MTKGDVMLWPCGHLMVFNACPVCEILRLRSALAEAREVAYQHAPLVEARMLRERWERKETDDGDL